MSSSPCSPGELLAAFPFPAVVTDVEGRCLDSNPAFQQRLVEGGRAYLTVGRVRLAAEPAQRAWDLALAEAGATAATARARLALPGLELELHVSPLGAGGPRPLLLAVFSERPAPAAPHLPETGRLTRAERDVLAGLLRGLPAKAIAAERNASINTVRAQIVSILDKTGHASQRELLAAYGASSFGQSLFGDSLQGTP